MYIVLGSTARSRYKEDILRFLAAPIGATIQARYDKDLVPLQTYNNIVQARKKEALVCFVDLEAHKHPEKPFPMIPLRHAKIKDANIYGTTLVLNLETKEFAYAESIERFTTEIAQGGNTPHIDKKTGKRIGFFFFSVSGMLKSVVKVTTSDSQRELESWQKIADQLFQCKGFEDEPFFWTILGLHQRNTSIKLPLSLPSLLGGETTYYLPIYHYHPNATSLDEHLSIRVGGAVTLYSPEDIKIDCRYDLKQPRLRTSPGIYKKQTAWITIGPKNRWKLELTLIVQANRLRPILSFLAAVVGFAIPNIPTALSAELPRWLNLGLLAIGALLVAGAVVLGTSRKG